MGSGRPFRWPGLGGGWLRQEVVAEVVDLEALPCRKGKAPLARWPCRLSRLVGRAGDNMDLRDRAERSERTRWTVMLKRIIVESELPASEGWNADPDGTAWPRIGKGREIHPPPCGSTSRPGGMWLHGCTAPTMCHDRGPLSSSSSTSCVRQEHPHKFDEDPHVHRGGWGGAGEGKALQASRFAEHLGGGQSGAGELGSARTAAGGADPGRDRHGFGAIRDDGGGAQIPRAYAWFRLVKLWGALHFSDTQGMPLSKLEMSGRGLRGVLERTKTTGAGKKVRSSASSSRVDAWLEEPRWLGGLPAVEDHERGGRLVQSGLLSGKYYHASQMSQALMAELMMSQRKQDELEGVGRPGGVLLCQGAGTVWSEHSERATLRSWAASLGVDNYVTKQLGRWQPSTDYVRSIRATWRRRRRWWRRRFGTIWGAPTSWTRSPSWRRSRRTPTMWKTGKQER